jgi:hypothetical protein
MTLTDLNAMLHLQLKHFGVLPLWQLLDAAINPDTPPFEVKAGKGPGFKWRDGAVHVFFETFDGWAHHGSGAEVSSKDGQLRAAYTQWTHEYRQYLAVLAAHGIPVRQHLFGLEDKVLEDSFLVEESTATPVAGAMPVTEHSVPELGTIAITVISGQRQMNFYPLQANGLNDIHRYIQEQGFAGDIAFPGRICHNASERRLVPDVAPR